MIERFIGESPRFRQYLDASEPLDLRHETKGLMPESIGAATSAEAVINTFAKLEAHLGEGVADRACAMYLGGPSASQEDLFDVCAACMTVTNGERAWTGRSVEAALHILTWAMNA